ncbi:MAG: class I SAM-dependent methyltransferase [Leptolyngbya sp. SIO3F4]|nr:class I SAM-dependent methyltransferase [Leptolyngbya sp. SIO3F4]
MRNKASWKPNKYVYQNGKLAASDDVAICSRLVANISADFYDRHIKSHCKGQLLDLGCGNVPLYEAYKDFVDDVTCVDWSNTFHKNQFLDHECDLTEPLPLETETFDTIICSDVLEHLPNPENLWEEMYRVLNQDGKALINVPFFYWIHEAPYDYHRYTCYSLQRSAESVGFKVVFLEPTGGWPEVTADFLAKFLHFRPVVGNLLALTVQNATQSLLKTPIGKRISKNSNHIFPLGYFMVVHKQ